MPQILFDKINVTEKDGLHILALLRNPPAPNNKLLAAAVVFPKLRINRVRDDDQKSVGSDPIGF